MRTLLGRAAFGSLSHHIKRVIHAGRKTSPLVLREDKNGVPNLAPAKTLGISET